MLHFLFLIFLTLSCIARHPKEICCTTIQIAGIIHEPQSFNPHFDAFVQQNATRKHYQTPQIPSSQK